MSRITLNTNNIMGNDYLSLQKAGQKNHSKRYEELIELAKTRGPIDEFGFFFTDEEIEFLGREDLLDFAKRFPAEAEYYMIE
jgi:hypothetical protein